MPSSTDQVRRSLMNIAVRLRERISKSKGAGTMGGAAEYVLTVLAEEIEKEATGKRRKPEDK